MKSVQRVFACNGSRPAAIACFHPRSADAEVRRTIANLSREQLAITDHCRSARCTRVIDYNRKMRNVAQLASRCVRERL
jgi:hypothetical protein